MGSERRVMAERSPLFSAQCSPIGIHPELYVCPSCGAGYPTGPGTCHGFGADKHEPRKVVKR